MFRVFRVLGAGCSGFWVLGVPGVQGAWCCALKVFRVLGVQGVQGDGCWVFRVFRVLGARC